MSKKRHLMFENVILESIVKRSLSRIFLDEMQVLSCFDGEIPHLGAE